MNLLTGLLVAACLLIGGTIAAAATDADIVAIVRASAERAKQADDPAQAMTWVARDAASHDSKLAREMVDRAAELAAKRPPARFGVYEDLATIVSASDPIRRDELLKMAIDEADAVLADDDLWKSREILAGQMPRWDPAREFEQTRTLLELKRRLWLIILSPNAETDEALKLLLADADDAGWFGSDDLTPYRSLLLDRLAWLDPNRLVSSKVIPTEEITSIASTAAYRRFDTFLPDSVNLKLLRFAIQHDADERGRINGIFAWHVSEVDWTERLIQLSGRDRAIAETVKVFARRDRAAAEKAVDALADEAIKSVALQTLKPSLGSSDPFRIGLGDDGKPTPAEIERRRSLHNRLQPQVTRILDDPGHVDWLADEEWAERHLTQAATRLYFETLDLAATTKLIDVAARHQDDRDAMWCQIAYTAAQTGRIDHAAEALTHVENNPRALYRAMDVLRLTARDARPM